MLGLYCCTQASLAVARGGCSGGGAPAPRCGGFSCFGVQARALRLREVWHTASVILAHRLSCSTARGIFPDQGSNPRTGQAASYPLYHQESPT